MDTYTVNHFVISIFLGLILGLVWGMGKSIKRLVCLTEVLVNRVDELDYQVYRMKMVLDKTEVESLLKECDEVLKKFESM